MNTYPILSPTNYSYENYLISNEYVSNLNNKSIKLATKQINRGQALSSKIITDTLNNNFNFLSENIISSGNKIVDKISELNFNVELGFDQLNEGITGLRSDFNISMGKVLVQFEIMRSEIQMGLNHLILLLENRRKTEAQEHFRDALNFYKDGCKFTNKSQWFSDALKHFLLSIDIYSRNPIAHLLIGHIYHYQQEHRDFNKALEHYNLCSMYGESDCKDYSIAAQGYFYAGWLQACVFKNLDEGIFLTKESLKLDPKIAEAHYHLSKFYTLNNEDDLAIKHLRIAIEKFDINYCIKASSDPDFNKIRKKVNNLLILLKEESKAKFYDELKKRLKASRLNIEFFESMVNSLDKFSFNVVKIISAIQKTIEEDTFFRYVNELPNLIQVRKLKTDYKKEILFYKHLDSNLTEINNLKAKLKTVINTMVPIQKSYKSDLENELNKVNNILKEPKIENFVKAYDCLNVISHRNKYLWISHEEYELEKRKKIEQKERLEKERLELEHKIELERKMEIDNNRKKLGLCLNCGERIRFFNRLRGKKMCHKCE